jgi:hypothetical protein
VQFSDFFLKVKVDGAALPNEVFIDFGKVQYRLTKDAANEFTYKFTNVQRDTEFKLFASGVESNDYALSVIKKPSILSFNSKLVFPEYIGRPTEELSNVGDLVVPQGTNISWVFNAQNTDMLGMQFGAEGGISTKRFDNDLFQYNRKAIKDESYKVFISNQFLPKADSVGYSITIIPDLHPQINVQEFKDSTNTRLLFFAGDASDDYGLLNLTFNYQIKKVKEGQMPLVSFKIEKPAGKQAQYDYNWDLRNIELKPGDEISYYFEVFDNDGVNGSKNARTGVMQYRLPSVQEMEKKSDATSDEIKKELEKALKESLKVQEEMKKLREKVLQKKEFDWQSKKEMEKLMNRQKQLNEQLEKAKINFQENKKQQEQFQEKSEELLKKEEQLEKLMDQTMSEEMKKLMEEIEKMMQEMNKEEALEKMEKMEVNNDELTKELDRLEELYKRLDVENKLEQNIDKLEKLAEEQQKLAEETEKAAKPDEELKKEQEELNKKMDEIEKNQEELIKKNEELKKPEDIEKNKEEMNDIQEDQKESKEEMEKDSKSGASKKQKSAANKMKNLANKMKAKKDKGEMKQIEEDIAALRQLLENLVGLSFNQEQNMKEIGFATINTPRYVELAQQQYKIKDDFKLVEDSLQAMARRNFQIESIITEKVTEIKASIKTSLTEIEERHVPLANEQQQRSMKSLNDLALMLSEIMGNMQQKMADAMPGDQSCQNPGKGKGKGKGGKEPKDKMSKGQQGIGEGLQDLKKRLEEGKKDGKDGKSGFSKEFAKMAAQQAALRNAMREMQKKKQEQGKGSKALDELMQEMDKIETDLVNKKLSNETMKRQQDIMTRLLEEERAEREREQDEQRQSESAKQQPTKLPPALEEYLKKRRSEVDLYKTVSPALKPYYKGLVEEYIKAVQK